MNTFNDQKTKFKVKQPLLSLQLKDQGENQRAPVSSPFHSILKNLLAAQVWGTTAISRHVALPNISLWAITGTCSCPGLQCKGRWEPSALPVPAMPCPCPCKHRCLGEAENHNCSQHWQQEYPCISAPTTLGKVCPVPTGLLFSLTTRLDLFKGQRIYRHFSDLGIFRLWSSVVILTSSSYLTSVLLRYEGEPVLSSISVTTSSF